MLIQFHILQNYAPANLNRDDTGSPKDAYFGGVRRGRISSQCLKRSIRLSEVFKTTFEKDGLIGFRTQRLPFEISKELRELGANDEEIKAIVGRLSDFGKSSKNDKDANESSSNGEITTDSQTNDEKVPETKQLIFLSKSELHPFAEKLLALYRSIGPQKWADKKATKVETIEKELGASVPRSVDIALFGRMTTSAAFEDIQAAAQVAHAISTNALIQEFDYYTAIDDLKPDNELGADMIGDVEFNSSTYYKYLNVHLEGLIKNLGDDVETARQTVLALAEAIATAHPTGKQNSFAAFNVPDLVLVEITQKNLPVSYANAFIKPVCARGDKSIMDVSVEKLGDYIQKVVATYNLGGKRAFIATQAYVLPHSEPQHSLEDLKKWLDANLPR